jgi:hypothetical protein
MVRGIETPGGKPMFTEIVQLLSNPDSLLVMVQDGEIYLMPAE